MIIKEEIMRLAGGEGVMGGVGNGREGAHT